MGLDATDDVSAWIRDARRRWLDVSLDDEAFRATVEALRHGERLEKPAFPLDLWLAVACTNGDAAALRAFEREVLGKIPDALRRVDPSPAFAADVCQALRMRLLLPQADEPPRIASYTGEVPLGAWVRVIALRLAFNAKRDAGAGAARVAAVDEREATDDPEMQYIRERYRSVFGRAFEAALTALPKQDQTLLRMHYEDRVNLDGLARVFGVHRATVARWLVRVRGDLLAEVKERMCRDLGATAEEISSVLGLVGEDADVTLTRALASTPAVSRESVELHERLEGGATDVEAIDVASLSDTAHPKRDP